MLPGAKAAAVEATNPVEATVKVKAREATAARKVARMVAVSGSSERVAFIRHLAWLHTHRNDWRPFPRCTTIDDSDSTCDKKWCFCF